MKKQKKKIPDSVTDISERDFWSSLRPVDGRPNRELLLEAIRLGRAGRKAAAYTRLGVYYRDALSDEWRIVSDQARKQPKPSAAALQNLFRHKITVWHTQTYQFGKRIDWAPADLPADSLSGMHYLSWLSPMVTAFLQRPDDARVRAYLADMVWQYYDARRHPRWEEAIRDRVFNGLGIAAKWPGLLGVYLGLIRTNRGPAVALECLIKMFLGFGRALDWQLRSFLVGNNGFVAANVALLHIARAFAEFKESSRWDRKAAGFLVRHAREGFFPDGGNRERVWGYGTMHVSGLSRTYEIMRRYGGGTNRHEREILRMLRRACRWYFKSVTPSPLNAFPTYGDAGWGKWDSLPTIQDMARCLPEADKNPMLGVDRTKSFLLKPSGFAVMRNGNDKNSSYVNISFGKFAGWHSHWDLLSMNFWALGAPLLEELCRFGPYCNPLDQLFRAPESHNLMLIDGMVYDSRLVEGRDVQWFSNDVVDYFSAYHRAYRFFVYGRDASPVSPNIEALVRRTVLLVKNPGYVVVLDSVRDINAAGFNAAISQYWHSTHPFRVLGPGLVRTAGNPACLLVYGQTESLHRLDTSKDFGGKEVAHLGVGYDRYCLRARRWLPLNHQGISGFTVVLYPFRGKAPNVTVRSLPTVAGSPWKTEAIEVSGPHGRDRIILNPEGARDFTALDRQMTARAIVRLGSKRGECIIRNESKTTG